MRVVSASGLGKEAGGSVQGTHTDFWLSRLKGRGRIEIQVVIGPLDCLYLLIVNQGGPFRFPPLHLSPHH